MKFKSPLMPAAMLLAAFLLTAASANAALVSRLGGQAVYDTDRNLTWLTNANLAATNTFGLATNVDLGPNAGVTNFGTSMIIHGSIFYPNGYMTWGGALKWIDAMNVANYLGFSDWRLPATLLPDHTCGSVLGNGASSGYSCTGSEMGHLFYQELGGVAGQDISTVNNGSYGLFSNFQTFPRTYWSRTDDGGNMAYGFKYSQGFQDYPGLYKDMFYTALVVRSGDVAPVPMPAAVWLFASGLLGLAATARRRMGGQ